MKTSRLLLALCLIPIVMGGQACLNWREIEIRDATLAGNGQVFAIVSVNRSTREIWRWSKDLSQCDVIWQKGRILAPIAANDDGSTVVFRNRGSDVLLNSLIAIDTRRSEQEWFETIPKTTGLVTEAFFVLNQQYICLIQNHWFRNPNEKLSTLTVVRAADGGFVGRGLVLGEIEYVMLSASRIICMTNIGKYYTYDFSDTQLSNPETVDDIEEILSGEQFECHPVNLARIKTLDPFEPLPVDLAWFDMLDPPIPLGPDSRSFVAANTSNVFSYTPTLRVCVNEIDHFRTIHEVPLSVSKRDMLLFVLLLSSAVVAWAWLLIRDGVASQRPWRFYLDLGIIVGMLLLVCVRFWMRDGQVEVYSQTSKAIALASAVVLSLSFLLMLGDLRAIYGWLAVLVGCAFVPAAPLIALLFALRACNVRLQHTHSASGKPPPEPGENLSVTNGSRFRFGIGGVLLTTAAIALLMSVGGQSLIWILVGIAATFLVAFSILLSLGKLLAMATCFASLFLIVMASCGEWMLLRTDLVPEFFIVVLIVPFVFAFARLYGYAIRHVPRQQTVTIGVEPQ